MTEHEEQLLVNARDFCEHLEAENTALRQYVGRLECAPVARQVPLPPKPATDSGAPAIPWTGDSVAALRTRVAELEKETAYLGNVVCQSQGAASRVREAAARLASDAAERHRAQAGRVGARDAQADDSARHYFCGSADAASTLAANIRALPLEDARRENPRANIRKALEEAAHNIDLAAYNARVAAEMREAAAKVADERSLWARAELDADPQRERLPHVESVSLINVARMADYVAKGIRALPLPGEQPPLTMIDHAGHTVTEPEHDRRKRLGIDPAQPGADHTAGMLFVAGEAKGVQPDVYDAMMDTWERGHAGVETVYAPTGDILGTKHTLTVSAERIDVTPRGIILHGVECPEKRYTYPKPGDAYVPVPTGQVTGISPEDAGRILAAMEAAEADTRQDYHGCGQRFKRRPENADHCDVCGTGPVVGTFPGAVFKGDEWQLCAACHAEGLEPAIVYDGPFVHRDGQFLWAGREEARRKKNSIRPGGTCPTCNGEKKVWPRGILGEPAPCPDCGGLNG